MAHADETKRPSRRGWPVRTQPTTTPAGTHDHDLPSWVFRAIVGMSVAVIVLAIAVGVLLVYVIGRGAYRDSETERIEEQIREGQCDLLDQLPEAWVLLDGPRTKYHCGPGVPVESFPPEIQQQLRPQPTPEPEPAPAATPEAPPPTAPIPDPGPPSLGGATGPPAEAEPPPVAPRQAPPPAPAPPSAGPASPLLDLVCDTTRLCVEVPPL